MGPHCAYIYIAAVMAAFVLAQQDYNAVSNAGTEFFLMFMPNIVERTSTKNSLALIISNPDDSSSALVKIAFTLRREQELNEISIRPHSSVEHMLSGLLTHNSAGLGNHTLYIQSSIPVTVIGVNRQRFSTDTFLAFPRSSLGVGYIGACYTAEIRTQIGIVSTEDDTLVRVTLPKRLHNPDFAVAVEHNGIYYSNAVGASYQFTIRLNKHESYLLTAKGDLTSTQIRSNKIISVFSGNVRANMAGCTRDHLVEQLLPVYAWQSEWFTVPTPRRTEPDSYRVLSNTAKTRVIIELSDGTSLDPLVIPTPREFAEVLLPRILPARFNCSPGKCLVYQVSHSIRERADGDPSLFMASNPDSFGSYKYIYRAPESSHGGPFNSNYLVIMSREEVEVQTQFSSGQIRQDTITWSYMSRWRLYYAELSVYTRETVTLRTNSASPFLLWIHGMSYRDSYSHSLGYNIKSPSCLGVDQGLMEPGDKVDNDCDSLTDEEPGIDGIDNDNDGLIDEDVSIAESKLSSGQEYLIMFMENSVEYPVYSPMEVFLGGLNIKNNEPTRVEMSYPLEEGGRNTIEMFVYPREVHKIELNYTVMQYGTSLKSKAIRIVAEDDIVVYGINKEQFSADGFIAIPVSSFGKEYFAMCYFPPTSRSEFAIVAPENRTTVRIFFPPLTHPGEGIVVNYGGRSYINNERLIVRMNALETLQIQDHSGSGDLSGTRIVADKNIGVFSGNVRTFVSYDGVELKGSRDHLVEQLPPVSSYGTKFAMMTTPGREVGDVYKMVTSEDNTDITICIRFSSSSETTCKRVAIAAAGSHHVENLFTSNAYIYIESEKPILVVQITRSQIGHSENADPAMMLIAPLEQYSKDYTFLTPTISNPGTREDYRFHYLLVIIDHSLISGLRLDNNSTSLSGIIWERIPNSAISNHSLVATSVKLPFALHTLTHTDPNAVYMGLLYGVADRESYGFPIGLKVDNLQMCAINEGSEGDLKDNDCDGLVDEEICGNELDDDNDGRLDEDCAFLPTAYMYLAVFMENNVEYPTSNYPLRLYGASYHRQVVRVTTPKYLFKGMSYDRAQLIDSEEVLNFGMRPDIRHIGSSVNTRGIIVRSQYPIDLFGSNEEKFSHDCFLVLPATLLGHEYYSVHSTPSTLQQQFSITAPQESTEVTVTLPDTLIGKVEFGMKTYYANDVFVFTLNIGDSAQIQNKQLPFSGLSGTKIISNKPIAVFSGNVRTSVAIDENIQKSRDHLVEQLLPYSLWASEYLAPSSPLRNYSDVFVFIAKANSVLRIEGRNGSASIHELPAGRPTVIKLASGDVESYRFSASLPFQVVRFTASQYRDGPVGSHAPETDPAMLLLIPLTYWKDRYTFALPVFTGGVTGGDYVHVIQILILTTKTSGFQLDSKTQLSIEWRRVGTSSYSTTNVVLAHVEQVSLAHVNNVHFMAYLYGAADRESYAMPCGVAHG